MIEDFSDGRSEHARFQQWRREHPSGVFLAFKTRNRANLHAEGGCTHPGDASWQPTVEDASSLTTKRKVCGEHASEIIRWAADNGIEWKWCADCERTQGGSVSAPSAEAKATSTGPQESLVAGQSYSWTELGAAFGFKESYLGAAGGMVSRPEHGVVLLMTHPGGAKSFDYEDYWDGDDLIYTGRGKTGDQALDGQNRDVAENAKRLLVFQPAGVKLLEYLGEPSCVEYWWANGKDSAGASRKVVRFRLRFGDAVEELDAYKASEGARRRVIHDRIERDGRLIALAKKTWRARDPLLRCEACAFSFREHYGDLAPDFIEAHHRKPLSELAGEEAGTTVADLAALCANCHRVLHKAPSMTVETLRELLLRAGQQ